MNREKHSEVKDRAAFILDFYFNEKGNCSLDNKIQEWLQCGIFGADKDNALWNIWKIRIRYVENPRKSAYESLKKIRIRLGFAAPETRKTPLYRRAFFRITAALLLAVAAGTLLFTGTEGVHGPEAEHAETATEPLVFSTGDAVRRRVELPDGSKAWISRNGKITCSGNFAEDRTILLEGEAYFAVAKQGNKPFTVNGKGISVKALNTEFRMNSGSKNRFPEVALAKGSAEVTARRQTRLVRPGEQVVYNNRLGKFTLQQIVPKEIAPWKGLDLVFENVPLSDVFLRVSRFYGVDFAVDDQIRLEHRITAAFKKCDPLEEVLCMIGNICREFEHHIRGNRVTLVKANPRCTHGSP